MAAIERDVKLYQRGCASAAPFASKLALKLALNFFRKKKVVSEAGLGLFGQELVFSNETQCASALDTCVTSERGLSRILSS